MVRSSGKQCLGATQPDFRLLGESPKPQICSFGQATRFVNADKKFYRKRKITFEGFSDCFLFNFGFSDQRKVCNAMVWVRRYADGRVACFTTPIAGTAIKKQKKSPTRDLSNLVWAIVMPVLKLRKHRRGCRWLLRGLLPPGGRRYSVLWMR